MKTENLLVKGIDILRQNDKEIEILLTDDVIPILNQYISEIELFNPAYGLVGTTDPDELIIKHILDSLAPIRILYRLLSSEQKTYQIADAGSGAGLPGIPLAIALPSCAFTLIERMKRRTGFLFNTKAVLSLSNITIEENEIEKAPAGNFDLITFRAFKPLEPKLLKTLFKLCKPDGIIAAYKGRREKIEEEMEALTMSNEQRAMNKEKLMEIRWEVIPYKVPFLEEERHILVIRGS